MKKKYITLVGFEHYFGIDIFTVASVFKIKKDIDNPYDKDAIKVVLGGMTVAYVANSVYTVVQGTYSAGRIYDTIKKKEKIKIEFVTNKKVIARIL